MNPVLHLRRTARARPDAIATVDGERRRSWREVIERVAARASGLLGLGLAPGDRVAILALNGAAYFELLAAIAWAGGVAVPLNWRLSPAELATILEDCGASLVFVDAASRPLLAGVAHPTVRQVAELGDLDPAAFGDPATVPVDRSPDALAALAYTGGTTGRPKGVMLSDQNLAAAAVNLSVGLGYGADTVYLHAPPLFHTADSSSSLGVTLAGGRHVFMPRFDPAAFLRLVAAERVTHTTLVPTMVGMILDDPGFADSDVSSLRGVCFGAAPMAEGLLLRTLAGLPGARFQQAWGMTELTGVATLLHPSFWRPDADPAILRSCGQALALNEVRVVTPDCAEAGPEVIGEIVARGAARMLGYWNRPDETARALRGGWMHSEDVGFVDRHGFLHVVDRLKDMIVTGGENVYAAEVESVISLLPGVLETAVIGAPHPVWGEVVHAIVVPRPGHGLAADDVVRHCQDRIAGYKCPRSIEIRPERLPLSGAGKVLKGELRAALRPPT